MKKITNFLALSLGDRLLLLGTMSLLLTVRVCLWLFPFRYVCRWLARLATPKNVQRNKQYPQERLIWAVESVSPYVPDATCLTRALTLQVLFARAGSHSDLCIGVAKNASGKLEAHAWLTQHERILIGALPDLERYILLPSLKGLYR